MVVVVRFYLFESDLLRETEVEHFHDAAIVNRDVCGFDIAVNDVVPVRFAQCFGHFANDA